MSTTDENLTSAPAVDETEALLKYLQTHDALCPLCKYNLRNLTVPRCPECGREIKLTVGLTEPHMRGLVMFLVPLCLSAGCGILSFVIVADEVVREHDLPNFTNDGWAVACLIYGTTLSVIPAGFGIALHRRFIRLQKSTQLALSIWAWLWDAFLMLLLLGLVFRVFR